MSDDSVALRQAKRADLVRLKEIAVSRLKCAVTRCAARLRRSSRHIASSTDRTESRRLEPQRYFPQFHTAPIGVCVQHGPTWRAEAIAPKRPLNNTGSNRK